MGSFRLAAGRLHHHKHFNFAESRRRQCGHRYAIRAGRNLPDKEFRYLRTVIVTAAVFTGTSIKSLHLISFNLPAPGRRHTLYVHFRVCRVLCFLLNSRSHQFIATLSSSWRRPVKLLGRTLSRSYGPNLPSSFSRVLSSALEYLSRPPVSVCGTVIVRLKLRGFSWNHFRLPFFTEVNGARTLEFRARICLKRLPPMQGPGTSTPGQIFRDPVPPSHLNNGAGILTCFPSATHFCTSP